MDDKKKVELMKNAFYVIHNDDIFTDCVLEEEFNMPNIVELFLANGILRKDFLSGRPLVKNNKYMTKEQVHSCNIEFCYYKPAMQYNSTLFFVYMYSKDTFTDYFGIGFTQCGKEWLYNNKEKLESKYIMAKLLEE